MQATTQLLWLCALTIFRLAASADPTSVNCYIQVSASSETCYYYHPGGYECERDTGIVDPLFRGLPACQSVGICYVPLAGDKEVCYYTPPWGYDCYYELIPALIANMTHCDLIKANSAPEVTAVGNKNTIEDTPLPVKFVTIVDLDAAESEREGKGYIEVSLTITNGYVAFMPELMDDMTEQNDAEFVLDTSTPIEDGVDWIKGNGSYSNNLQFLIRTLPLSKLMKSLVILPAANFNTNKGTSTLTVFVNDRGNTGGTAETTEELIVFRATPVNDPPTISYPDQGYSNEDAPRMISNLIVDDVDVHEISASRQLQVILTVSKGSINLIAPYGPVGVCGAAPCKTPGGALRLQDLPSVVNLQLAKVEYTPNANANDDTGVELMTIDVNDLGATGAPPGYYDSPQSITKNMQLHITPINDYPTISTPVSFNVDEDLVSATFTGFTINDVDTTSGITLTLTVAHGTLSATVPAPESGAILTETGTLTQLNNWLHSITYQGDVNYNGVDNLVINMNDNQVGGNAPAVTVNVNVEAVNDPPTIDFDCPSQCTLGFTGHTVATNGQTIQFPPMPGAVPTPTNALPRIIVNDPDSADKKIQILLVSHHGTITLASTTGLTFQIPRTGPYTSQKVLYFTAKLDDVNVALTGLTYTKTENVDDVLLVAVGDQTNQGKGEAGHDFVDVPIFLV